MEKIIVTAEGYRDLRFRAAVAVMRGFVPYTWSAITSEASEGAAVQRAIKIADELLKELGYEKGEEE